MNFDLHTTEGLNNTIAILLRRRFMPPIMAETKYAPDGYSFFCRYDIEYASELYYTIDVYTKGTGNNKKYYITNIINPRQDITSKKFVFGLGETYIYSFDSNTLLKELEIIYIDYYKDVNIDFYSETAEEFYQLINAKCENVYNTCLPYAWYDTDLFDHLTQAYYTNSYNTNVYIYYDKSRRRYIATDYSSYYWNITSRVKITDDNIGAYYWMFYDIFEERWYECIGRGGSALAYSVMSDIERIFNRYDPDDPDVKNKK